MNPERQFLNFHFRGHLPPKSEIENRSNRHLTQSRLQVTCCTAEILYCLLHVVVQWPGSFQGLATFLYDVRLRSYGASKLPSFRTLAYFPHKTRKTYLPVTSLQGLHRRINTIFPCHSRMFKGVPLGSGVFLRLLIGELGTPNLPKFSPMANGYIHSLQNATVRRVRSGPKTSENAQF